jgi:hypothetical protein
MLKFMHAPRGGDAVPYFAVIEEMDEGFITNPIMINERRLAWDHMYTGYSFSSCVTGDTASPSVSPVT